MSNRPRTFGALLDELVLSATIVLETKRGFCESPLAPPPTHEELIAEVDAAPPVIRWSEGRSRRRRVRIPVELPAQAARTYVDLFPATGPAPDTLLVYHHGLGEIPHDMIPRVLRLSRTLRERCDVIAVKGLHHERFPEVSRRLTSDLHRFIRCLVASTSIVGEIAKQRRAAYEHLVMSGVSMGGVISLIEASHDSSFDLYVPFVAGPNLRDVVLRSGFSRTVQSRWLKGARNAGWARELDMTWRLEGGEGAPIRPLLASCDRLFRMEAQLAAYERVPRARVETFRGGHISGAAQVHVLARHLLRALREERWSASRVVATPALIGA